MTAFALFITGAMFDLVPSSEAQDANPAPVTFGQPTVTQNGQPIDKQLDTRDRVSLSFPWTANGTIEQGQTMSIDFPTEILPPANKLPFSVSGQEAGSCEVQERTLVCTFNRDINQDSVTGSIGLNVGLGETPGPDWKFNTVPGGEPLSVAIPGGSVVPYVLPEGKEDRVSKYGTIDYVNNVIDWTIIIPAENLTDENGQARSVRITDQLQSRNHAYVGFDDPNRVVYVYQEDLSRENQAWPNSNVTAQDGGRGFAADIAPQRGGWNPEWDLKITYQTEFVGDPQDREKFDNSANVVVTDSQGIETTTAAEERNAGEHTYDAAAAAAGAGVERGSFALTKTVIGEQECIARIEEPFTVQVDIDVRDSVGPNFQFPGTVKQTEAQPADGKISYTAALRPGTTLTGYDSLPQGSKVTITEVKPDIAGVEFADPDYSPGQTVTIENAAENATIELTNRIESCPQPTTEQPEPTTTEEQPEPTTTEEQPEPTTTEEQPEPTTTDEEPEPTTTEEQPEPTTTDEEPEPTTTDEEPEPTTTDEEPEPTTTDEEPEPTTTDEQPEPTTTDEEPEPTTTDEEPEPTTTEEQPEPTTTEEQPEPTTTDEEPEPTTTDEEPEPTTTDEEPEPTTTDEQPEPTTTDEQPEPTTTDEAPEPTTTDEQPEPTTTEEQPEPTTTDEQPEPTTTEEQPEPTTTDEQPEPTTTAEESPTTTTTGDQTVPGGDGGETDGNGDGTNDGETGGDDNGETDGNDGETDGDGNNGETDGDGDGETGGNNDGTDGEDDGGTNGNGDGTNKEGSSALPWWLLLLVPVIPIGKWLIDNFPGGSSNPAPGKPSPGEPAPGQGDKTATDEPGGSEGQGDKPKGKQGDEPKGGNGDKPQQAESGQPGRAPGGQPAQPGKPGGGRQSIQSVPSGATAKSGNVPDFIG
ncbi:hypothetical protein [Corynebacterium sp. CCUG 70398]|uniref:hypothetical protein n=1 Tax=Corynebacterium sp. CCUG 70398 TaxID=2823891 RepID=UPI00210E5938|nr:hypothetical protein [Corynebacterium sp. CCUG 70398]MCQ4623261.1 hypothetical protein [Corynebacterium sp. CCUG 70398]